jgi:hypothetical protein
VKSEEVGAPADRTAARGDNAKSSNNNSSGDKDSEGSAEPAAEAQGEGYKLPDGDILIHTQAQV